VNISLNELTSHLGEPWNKMTLTGFNFVNLTTMETMSSVTITPDNKFIAIYPDVNADNVPDMSSVNDKTLNVTYDSEHALLTDRTIALPSNLQPTSEYNTQANNTVNYEVPYLFEENFDNLMVNGEKVTEYEYFDTTNDNGVAQSVEKAIDMGPRIGLVGWSGAKWWFRNNYLIVGAYFYTTTDWGSTKTGRIDTSQLMIKKPIKITVSYKVKGWDKATDGKGACVFGTSTGEGLIDGTSSWKNPATPEVVRADINQVQKFELADTESEPSGYDERTHIIDDCNSKTRLTWCCHLIKTGLTVSGKQFYMAIDDIKVSIGSEVK